MRVNKRNLKMAKQFGLKLLVSFGIAFLCSIEASFAKAKQTPNDPPDQEDYYSTAAPNLTPADRQKATQLRTATINQIQGMLSKMKSPRSSPQRFELILRLGELYSEAHDYIRDDEISAFNTRYDSWIKNGKKGSAPKISHKQSKAQLQKAADAFTKLVNDYPKNPRTAAALYALGKTMARLDNPDSIKYFERLLRDFKSSPLTADAQLATADYYFDHHQMNKAIDSYLKFTQHKSHAAYPYGVYKLGWAYYSATPKNDTEAKTLTDKSIDSFKLTIKLAKDDARTGKTRINLRDEALRDLVMVWADTENTDAAFAYFKTIGAENSYFDLLERLGNIYADQGRNAKAIELFARLVDQAPLRSNNIKIHERMLELYDGTNQPQKVVQTLASMQKKYASNSDWTIANVKDEAGFTATKSRVELLTRRYGTLFHKRAQSTREAEYLAAATAIYGAYLASFSESSNAAEIHFYYGDLLMASKKYETAADQFTIVASANKNPSALRTKAGFSAVVALNKADQGAAYPKLPPAGQVPQPVELPRIKQKLLNALDLYTTLASTDNATYAMRFTAAQILFDYGHYDRALERYEKIMTELPQTKQAEYSSKIILAYYSERKNWDKTAKLARQYLGSPKLSKDVRAFTVNILRTAMFNQALALEKSEKYEEAARAFLALQREADGSREIAEKSLFNAAQNFYRAGLLEDALTVNTRLIDTYPDSKLAATTMLNIGQTYEALAQYEKAAQFYKRYAQTYPKEKLAARALYNAANIFRGLENWDTSANLLASYVKNYPSEPAILDVKFELAEALEHTEHALDASAVYQSLAQSASATDQELALHAMAKAAVLTLNQNKQAEGRKLLTKVLQALKSKDAPAALEARELVASVYFRDVDAGINQFKSMAISSSRHMEDDVVKKQKRLESLARRYQEVMSIESPEYAVASLYRLGEMHEDFANKLMAVANAKQDVAPQLTAQARETVSKVAKPLREQAYKFYETAFKRSQEVETLTIWTRKTYDKMAELDPHKNPEVFEQNAEASYMAHRLSITPAVARLGN